MTALSLLLGLALLLVIGLATRRSPRSMSSQTRRLIGFALIAVPLPLAVVLHLVLRPASALAQIGFVLGVVAFGLGALLVLPGGDDEQPDCGDDPDPAPWWPEFEREFRAYEELTHARR